MDDRQRRDFTLFVNQRSHVLLRAAYALTGDQHAAEDLVQNALAKVAARWNRIEGEPEPYVRRVLYREFVSAWRWRRRRPEYVTDRPPERPSTGWRTRSSRPTSPRARCVGPSGVACAGSR
jgi:DNA-directed RNA polymerase specialized sigma24 family protein